MLTPQTIETLGLDLLTPSRDDDGATRAMKRESRNDLKRALRSALRGEAPHVAFYYCKDESKGAGRMAHEDFLPLPGIPDNFHMGQIVSVHVSKKGAIYFKLKDTARSDGDTTWSWTCVRVDRIERFQYRGTQRPARWTGKKAVMT